MMYCIHHSVYISCIQITMEFPWNIVFYFVVYELATEIGEIIFLSFSCCVTLGECTSSLSFVSSEQWNW